jgi:very-short-patch-repair endonuclease
VPHARRPSGLRGRVFRKRDVVSAGLLTESELRSSAWRQLFRGVYVDSALPDTVAVRISGAALLLPPSGVFSGRTAAYLHGATGLAEPAAPIEVSVPTGVRFGPVTGLRIRQVGLAPPDLALVGRWRCTSALRTALDIARAEPLAEAVAALDVLLARGVVGRSELHGAVVGLEGRGARRAERAVSLADPRAESPQESRLRVLLSLAGLEPVPQFTVRTPRGDFVARVDLAFPELKIAVEYDGAWHANGGQLTRDRQRLNRLVAAGWTVLHVTAADMRDPAALVARVKALLRAATSGK